VNLLLDENVPVQALPVLQRTLRGHQVDHVDSLDRRGTRWKGKKDRQLLPDAGTAGYEVFVTKDSNQLADPVETRLIKQSGIHHVRFQQDEGVAGYARAVGALVAAMADVVAELDTASGQRLVRIVKLDPKKRRHETVDPDIDPPSYWR
jgi:hypothetical protein